MKKDQHDFEPAAAAVIIPDGDTPPVEIELVPAGEVLTRKHDSRPPWENDDPEAVIAATRAENSEDFQVNYDHKPGPAAGWIKRLFARDGAIWAEVDWTVNAAAAIAAKEYRFISPEFLFDKATRKIKMITGAALTNDPALYMQAIASANSHTPEEETMKLDELKKILGIKAEATAEQVQAYVKAAAAAVKGLADIGKALGLEGEVTGETVTAALSAQNTALDGIREAAGVEKGASLSDVAAAVKTAKAAASANPGDNHGEFVPRAEFDRVKEDLGKLQSGTAKASATAMVDKAIENGKLTPASRDWGLGYAAADPEGFTKFVETAPTILKSGRVVPEGDPKGGGDTLTDDEKAVCRAMGITEEKFLESRKEIAAAAA